MTQANAHKEDSICPSESDEEENEIEEKGKAKSRRVLLGEYGEYLNGIMDSIQQHISLYTSMKFLNNKKKDQKYRLILNKMITKQNEI